MENNLLKWREAWRERKKCECICMVKNKTHCYENNSNFESNHTSESTIIHAKYKWIWWENPVETVEMDCKNFDDEQ